MTYIPGMNPPISQADFTTFLQTNVGIPTTVLPTDSPTITAAYNAAVDVVNYQLSCIPGSFYSIAVYNLGASFVLQWAPDLPGAQLYQNKLPFFAYMRDLYNYYGTSVGVVTSTTDSTTSTALTVPPGLQNLSLFDLQELKDPFGRTYVAIAQRIGSQWGIS